MAKKKKSVAENTMVGKWFHSVRDGVLCWQGVILQEPKPGVYLCQLFEWVMGERYEQRLVPLEDMKDWIFYNTGDEMRFSSDYGAANAIRQRSAKENKIEAEK